MQSNSILRRFLALVLLFYIYGRADAAGRSSSSSSQADWRVINGVEVNITEVPYQISIELLGHHTCGGSIISRYLVLTAAHCFTKDEYKLPLRMMQVRVGANQIGVGGSLHGVERVAIHKQFRKGPTTHDIAVIRLMPPGITFSDSARPIKIASAPPEVGTLARVSGYGSTRIQRRDLQEESHKQLLAPVSLKPPENTLHAVFVPIFPHDRCVQVGEIFKAVVADDILCAGFDSRHEDACIGDSGGPLAVDNTLVGITSWGIGCGREGIPGMYTNVARYTDWVVMVAEDLNSVQNNVRDFDQQEEVYDDYYA